MDTDTSHVHSDATSKPATYRGRPAWITYCSCGKQTGVGFPTWTLPPAPRAGN